MEVPWLVYCMGSSCAVIWFGLLIGLNSDGFHNLHTFQFMVIGFLLHQVKSQLKEVNGKLRTKKSKEKNLDSVSTKDNKSRKRKRDEEQKKSKSNSTKSVSLFSFPSLFLFSHFWPAKSFVFLFVIHRQLKKQSAKKRT